MFFNSIPFVFFFVVVAILNFVFPGRYRWVWLLAASVLFYMWSNPIQLLVPLCIISVSYVGGIQIEESGSARRKESVFLLSVIATVGVLAFFKYSNFISSSAFDGINYIRVTLFHSAASLENPFLLSIIAPIGISYITFQAIGYLIEVKRGDHPAERNLGLFSTYVMFFPKILAGPVERAHNFLPQLKKSIIFDYAEVSVGLRLIAWGLFKKLVIADRLSVFVNAVFNNTQAANGAAVLTACFFNTLQIYADFSGYTDMAIGMAKILGFSLTQNFDRPLLASSVTELWRRWHISLSSWFTDYVYSPIVTEKRSWGNWSVIYALLFTFLVIGLWHGASWNFVVFGLLQGILISMEFLTRKIRKRLRGRLSNVLGVLYTFSVFSFSLIFFTTHSLGEAFTIIGRIVPAFFTPEFDLFAFGWRPRDYAIVLLSVPLMELVHNKLHNPDFWSTFAQRPAYLRWSMYYVALFTILFFGVHETRQFIYFQF